MATYQIHINERAQAGKALLAYLQSVPKVVTFKKPVIEEEEYISKEELLERINNGFRDVRLMLDGKKRKKTAQELLYELENGL
jgi:flagellin-specific chaperone FliS